MGFINRIMGLPDPPRGGNGNGGGHGHKPSEEGEKHNKRRWYERQEEEMTDEERDRANPPDEPRDGKLW